MKLYTKTTITPSMLEVAWSNDSQKVAIAGADGGVFLYSRDFALIDFLQGYIERVRSFAWSPNDENLVCSQAMSTDRVDLADVEQRVVVWDVATNKLKQVLFSHPNDFVADIAWNKDGSKLAGSVSNNIILVWDVAGGKELIQLKGHSNYAKKILAHG